VAGLVKKQQTVEELKAALLNSTVTVVADYRGLTVAELTQLRRELYKENAQFTVTKNTLLRRAVEGTDLAEVISLFKGPTALAIGNADQVAPVKILKEFLKKNKKDNEIRGGLLDGKALSSKDVAALAELPPINELRGQLLGGIASPLNGLVQSLSGPQRALVNILDQYSKTKAS
jgi:large subunit ribosomal protein L10